MNLRNKPCPCGNGRKYKHCHGRPEAVPWPYHDRNSFGFWVSGAEIAALDLPPVDPLVVPDQLLSVTGLDGIPALHGPSGTGKTWQALQHALGLVRKGGRCTLINFSAGTKGIYNLQRHLDALEPNRNVWWDSIRPLATDLFTRGQLDRARELAIKWLKQADNPEHSLAVMDDITGAGRHAFRGTLPT